MVACRLLCSPDAVRLGWDCVGVWGCSLCGSLLAFWGVASAGGVVVWGLGLPWLLGRSLCVSASDVVWAAPAVGQGNIVIIFSNMVLIDIGIR